MKKIETKDKIKSEVLETWRRDLKSRGLVNIDDGELIYNMTDIEDTINLTISKCQEEFEKEKAKLLEASEKIIEDNFIPKAVIIQKINERVKKVEDDLMYIFRVGDYHPENTRKEIQRILQQLQEEFVFGEKVMWYDERTKKWYRAIFDFINKNGDAIILMHPGDFDRKELSWGHHDVKFSNLRRGWVYG